MISDREIAKWTDARWCACSVQCTQHTHTRAIQASRWQNSCQLYCSVYACLGLTMRPPNGLRSLICFSSVCSLLIESHVCRDVPHENIVFIVFHVIGIAHTRSNDSTAYEFEQNTLRIDHLFLPILSVWAACAKRERIDFFFPSCVLAAISSINAHALCQNVKSNQWEKLPCQLEYASTDERRWVFLFFHFLLVEWMNAWFNTVCLLSRWISWLMKSYRRQWPRISITFY